MSSDIIGFHLSLLLALVSILIDHFLHGQGSPQEANGSNPSSSKVIGVGFIGSDWAVCLSLAYHCGQGRML